MNKEASKILSKQISKIKPSDEEISRIKKETGKIVESIEKNAKKKKIKLEVFIGGSLAKGTLIRKNNYDIDIFVRFQEDKDISDKLSGLIKAERVHGSRDYFRINKKEILFEIIPVLKINKPEQAKNITDLSYFHVNYVLNKTKKNKKLADDIMLAKSFCYAQKVYGAESYIKGFSGYALELLVSYYGSFLNFLNQVAQSKEKIVLDPEKAYKNRQEILNSMNEAKLQSAIVFVDPTFKHRNALAALSEGTYGKFKNACISFLKKPSEKMFQEKNVDEKKFNVIVELVTCKQSGDIAGSKLAKFSRFIESKVKKYFDIKNKDFEYDGKKKARFYLNVKKKASIILHGPPINRPERLLSFKNSHKTVFLKNNVAYARENSVSLKEFFSKFMKDNKITMKDMGITGLKVLKK